MTLRLAAVRVSLLVAVPLLPAATLAATTITGTGAADDVCLLNINGSNHYCMDDRVKHGITSWPITVNLGGGGDDLVIRDSSVGGCSCTCDVGPGDVISSFTYGGYVLSVNGGTGDDTIIGGSGDNIFNGDGQDDRLSGGTYVDKLSGGIDYDIIRDRGGNNEDLYGNSETDCLVDSNSTWTNCDCGESPADSDSTANAACLNEENVVSGCSSISCPAAPFP